MVERSIGGTAISADLAYVDSLLASGSRSALGQAHAALPGLNQLALRHRLTAFDRDLLLVASAPNLDRKYVQHFMRADGDPRPSIGLVLALLADAEGLARDVILTRLGRGAPLLTNALVEIVGDGPFAARKLVVPEVVWQRMLGIADDTGAVLAPLEAAALIADDPLRAQIAAAVRWIDHRSAFVVVRGPAETGRTAVARAIASAAGRRLVATAPDATIAEIIREARWHEALPLVTRLTIDVAELATDCPAAIFVAGASEPVPAAIASRAFTIATERPTGATSAALWRRSLGSGVDVAPIVEAYRFGPARIEAASELALRRARVRGEPVRADDVADACRDVAPASALAGTDRLPAEISLDDLVLSPSTRLELQLAIAWSRHRTAIRDTAGPHLRMASGLACLFNGPSGTGKTTAARAVARELGLPLHRVDLARVIDKYIGETEKHLDRMFDEAEAANVVLLFDEADALFARRTEVRDAHDRFANVETGYLLQRLETHPGVVILATNLRRNFDDAFARRLQVIVEFVLPGVAERTALWRRMLPPPHDGIDVVELATRFPFAGGDIRNAVIAALVLARAEGVPLAMRHVIVATWREMQRSGRLANGNEFAGWQDALAGWTADPRKGGRRP